MCLRTFCIVNRPSLYCQNEWQVIINKDDDIYFARTGKYAQNCDNKNGIRNWARPCSSILGASI